VPILLDTCAAMWIMENERMKASAVEAIDLASDRGEPVFVSPITGWEVGLLAMKGRFHSRYAPPRWLEVLLAIPQIRFCEMPPHVLLESSFLPGRPPREPSDRIVAATAREYGFTVMTRDRELLDYAKQGHIAAEPENPGISAASCRKTLQTLSSILAARFQGRAGVSGDGAALPPLPGKRPIRR